MGTNWNEFKRFAETDDEQLYVIQPQEYVEILVQSHIQDVLSLPASV
jgi:hypothetical protein